MRLSSAAMRRLIGLLILMLVVSCGNRERRAAPDASSTPVPGDAAPARPDAADGGSDATEEAAAAPLTCYQRVDAVNQAIDGALSSSGRCRWDHECVLLPRQTSCTEDCPTSVVASEVVAARAAIASAGGSGCDGFEAAGCRVSHPACPELEPRCLEGQCSLQPASAARPERGETTIPEQNACARNDDPPPRPEAGAAEERAQRLFEAIVHDDPDRAVDFYLPREAFLELKGIADPGGYWDRLFPRYVRDIHALHRVLPDLDRAEFVRFELVRRGGWVQLREEGNSLPYHVSRHSWIHYRVGEEERRLEVRVLITWGNEWYVTHLCEFHCEERECCRAPE